MVGGGQQPPGATDTLESLPRVVDGGGFSVHQEIEFPVE